MGKRLILWELYGTNGKQRLDKQLQINKKKKGTRYHITMSKMEKKVGSWQLARQLIILNLQKIIKESDLSKKKKKKGKHHQTKGERRLWNLYKI